MKLCFGRSSLISIFVVLITVLFSATVAVGQDSSSSDGVLPALFAGGMLLFFLVIFAAMYVYFALALSTIATKTGTPNPWLAWIPIANLVLMVTIAKKPIWWIILCIIPGVGVVMAVLIWMAIAEVRNKPNWWGILMIIPPVNLIVPGYLAWAD